MSHTDVLSSGLGDPSDSVGGREALLDLVSFAGGLLKRLVDLLIFLEGQILTQFLEVAGQVL